MVTIKNACPVHGDVTCTKYIFNNRMRTIYTDPRHCCLDCYPINGFTIDETNMREFLEKNNITNFTTNDRSVIRDRNGNKLELDFYFPDNKVALEINGEFYHSLNYGKTYDYHFNKSNMCDAENIQLMHIWSDEIHKKKNIVESNILRLLGKLPKLEINPATAYVKRIDLEAAKSFYDENSLNQFDSSGNMQVGLYNNDTLVKLISINGSIILDIVNLAGYDVPIIYNKQMIKFAKIEETYFAKIHRDYYYMPDYTALNLKLSEYKEPMCMFIYHDKRTYTDLTYDKYTMLEPDKDMHYNHCFDSGYLVLTQQD